MTTTNNIGAQGVSWTVFGADFYWGIRELAMKREKATRAMDKERFKFHFSQAGRRTLNKAVDYLTYLLVGCVAGLAITEPMGIADHTTTAAVGLGFGFLFEISSIVGHIAAVKGINIKLNLKALIVALIRKKNEDIADILDEGIEEIEDNRRRHHHEPLQMDDYGQEDYHHCGDDAFDYENADIKNKDFGENLNEENDEDTEKTDEGI